MRSFFGIKDSKALMFFVCSVIALQAQAEVKIEYLSGDTRSACEALLCLSSPSKPAECTPALNKLFSIKRKKPSDTINARKAFLNLCPIDNSDANLKYYQTSILPLVDEECTISSLNARIETKKDAFKEIVCKKDENGMQICNLVDKVGFRINPNLTNSCKLLASSHYSDYRLKYTCNTKFHTKEEWQSGKEIMSEISKAEFESLPLGNKLSLSKWEKTKGGFFNSYSLVSKYYKTQAINKYCWINQN